MSDAVPLVGLVLSAAGVVAIGVRVWRLDRRRGRQ